MEELKQFEVPFFPDCKNIAQNWQIENSFPDAAKLLETAFFSLRRYLAHNGGRECGDGYRISIVKQKTSVFEEYSITADEKSCLISANDSEGIRRGIYEFIDIFCAAGGVFPTEKIAVSRKPNLSIRIARCPFSPIKRPPLNTDELLDDTDYYPEGYLETLAHDGSNGIWIVTDIKELGISSFTPEDPQRAQRLAKLQQMVKKCARYGIKIWLFMIEPRAEIQGSELLQQHPELFRKEQYWGNFCFCPASQETQQYLEEMFSSTFAAVPGLGGVINISIGERPTICTSSTAIIEDTPISCQDVCKLSKTEIMRKSLTAIYNGIRKGSPEAKFISWYYTPHAAKHQDWVADLMTSVPDGAVAQYNFESGGVCEQLGKLRCSGDYWISYEGPSDNFRRAAEARRGKALGAKLQLGSGHELVTVPFIPVPEIVYNKYKSMYELGVSSVMQSWYIGNFPSVISRACGKLAFEDFSQNSTEFLKRLAAPQWGKYSETVIKSWQFFTEAYKNMPFSLMFQYYGPQNAFMLWRYHFMPDLELLAPPWKPDFEFGGDNIGEALAGFTLDEAAELVKIMSEKWQEGIAILTPLKEYFKDNIKNIRDINVAEFIGYTLQGSSSLLEFFKLRRALYSAGLTIEQYRKILEEMKTLLAEHRILCEKCIPLLEFDSRLGYHGESLKQLFNADMTHQALKDTEISQSEADIIEQALAGGKTPLQYISEKKLVFSSRDTIYDCGSFSWSWTVNDDRLILKINKFSGDDILGLFSFTDLTGSVYPLIERFILKDGKCTVYGNFNKLLTGSAFDSGMKADLTGDEIEVSWPLASLPIRENMFRMNFSFGGYSTGPCANGRNSKTRLYLETIDPADTMLFVLK